MRDNNSEIYKLNADGSQLTRLTATAQNEYMPVWSPDNTKIAFYSYRDGNAEIYVMNADGNSQTRLTAHPAWDGHPTWSPDGSKIAFVSDRSGGYELWVMNSNGTGQQQLTTGLYSVGYLEWSPAGDRIAFNYDANRDGWLDLAVLYLRDAYPNRVLFYAPANHDYLNPAWAPNGKHLAFTDVEWIQYQGEWYWSSAFINYVLEQDIGIIYRLINSGYDWWPDWGSKDADTPICQVTSPIWSSVPTFTVQWLALETKSGLDFYELEYRDGRNGVWTEWFSPTIRTKAIFEGEYGHVYYFRCRARDYALNRGAYPTGDGHTQTYVSHYALSGSVLGNREQPIYLASIAADPSALNIALSDVVGKFSLYTDQGGNYDLHVERHSFGPIPEMLDIPIGGDAITPTFYLPPADDCIVNGGFESANLDSWHTASQVSPTITTTAHTGQYAVYLSGFDPSTPIPSGLWQSQIEQEIVGLPDSNSTTLSLIYRVMGADPVSDALQIALIGTTQILTYELDLGQDGWIHRWWDVSGWNDSPVKIRVLWQQISADREVGVVVDEISLGSAQIGSNSAYLPAIMKNAP